MAKYTVWNMLTNVETVVESDCIENALYTHVIDNLGRDYKTVDEVYVKKEFTLQSVADDREVFCVIRIQL